MVVVACFSPGLGNYFAGDDFNFIFLAVKAIHVPSEVLVPVAGFLRPTETLYFIANLLIAGVSPVAYQASLLLIHVLNFLLVSAFIARLSGSRTSGLIGATFWALHFRLAEAVLRPCAVPDPLALLFGLSAVLLLLDGRRGWAAAAFSAALLSKENAIVLLPLACSAAGDARAQMAAGDPGAVAARRGVSGSRARGQVRRATSTSSLTGRRRRGFGTSCSALSDPT